METVGCWYVPYRDMREEIALWGFADMHLFNRGCAVDRLHSDIAAVRADKRALCIGAGDYADYIAPNDKRFDPQSLPDDMLAKELGHIGATYARTVLETLRPLAHKFLGLGFGNHEATYMNHNSQQMLHGWLCKAMTEFAGHEVPDLGYTGIFDLIFYFDPKTAKPYIPRREAPKNPKGVYRKRVFVRHGEGAAQTPGGKLNSLVRKMREFEADIFFMGHTHDAQDQALPIIGGNQDCTGDAQHIRHGIRTGSYLRGYAAGYPGYGEIKGYSPTCIGVRGIILSPGRGRVVGVRFEP